MPFLKSKSAVLFATLVALASTASGCGGGVTQSNFDKVETGMTQDQVEAILGKGKDQTSNSVSLPGVAMSSKTIVWGDDQKKITVVFANGKVLTKVATGLS